MLEKIDSNQIPDILKESSSKQNDTQRISATSEDGADASLQVNYDSLIEKAMQTPQADDGAVQQAQELLQSGQLESPENIQEAAENIIKFGI